MPRLVRQDTGLELGTITDVQRQFLVDQLEQDDDDDDQDDYVINRDTLELLADNGCDAELLATLERALGQDDDLSIAIAIE